MALIDFGAELLAVLRSPDGRAAIAEAVRPVVAAEVRSALDTAAHDVLLDARRAAEHLRLTAAAFKQRRRRNRSLDALAIGAGRSRRWRKADLEAWWRDRERAAHLRAARTEAA